MMAAPPPGRLLVVTWRFPAFSETFVVDHLTGLLDHGWRVSLCCVELDEGARAGHGALAARLETVVVLGDEVAEPTRLEQLRRLGRERPGRAVRSGVARHAARLAPALRRVLSEVRPDLVHAHFGPNAAAAALARAEGGPPLIADLHGYDITEVPHAEGWVTYRRLLAGATVIVHSRFAAGRVQTGLGVQPVLVPYDPAPAFAPVDRPDHWSAPLRLLFGGRLVPEKGADLAVEALARLRRDRPDLDPALTVVGRGPAEPAVRARARELAVEDRVRFAGALPHDEVARTMAEHDVLLVPSRSSSSGWVEAFGLVAAEGTRSGLGVVVTRSGGLPEAVGPSGVVVEPADGAALAAGVAELLDRSNPAVLSAAAPSGRSRTGERYDRVARGLLST
jgi:glycosyltransferase involved in cell wall biosynthesis